jgi:hypothetical protein
MTRDDLFRQLHYMLEQVFPNSIEWVGGISPAYLFVTHKASLLHRSPRQDDNIVGLTVDCGADPDIARFLWTATILTMAWSGLCIGHRPMETVKFYWLTQSVFRNWFGQRRFSWAKTPTPLVNDLKPH